MAARLHRRVQADAELGDDVGALTGVRDQLAEHLRSAAAGDLDDTPGFEAQRDGLVDKSVDRVRDSEVGDEHAVGAVPQRRDEDFAARVVREPAVLEGERVRQPAASFDVQRQVGACAPANANPLRSLELGQQAPRRLLEVGSGLRELAFEQLGRDETHVDRAPAVASQRFTDGEAGWRLRGMRSLREEERERRPLGRVEDRLRRARHRAIAAQSSKVGRPPASLTAVASWEPCSTSGSSTKTSTSSPAAARRPRSGSGTSPASRSRVPPARAHPRN